MFWKQVHTRIFARNNPLIPVRQQLMLYQCLENWLRASSLHWVICVPPLGDFTILNGFSKDSIISWAFRCAVVKAFLFPSFSSHSLKERKRKGRNINTNILLVWLLLFHAVLLLTLTSHWQKWPSRDRELTLQAPPIPAVLVRPHACQSQYHCHAFPPYFFQHFHTVLSDY